MDKKNSQCQNELKNQGHFITSIELPKHILDLVLEKNYDQIDKEFHLLTQHDGALFKKLRQYKDFQEIEFIISLREAHNEWEEDGIWHDDGSRVLAFSLSLTIDPPKGGVLEMRKKGELKSLKIPTPPFSQMIVFATGVDQFEHKINMVTSGSRLVIAGWCT